MIPPFLGDGMIDMSVLGMKWFTYFKFGARCDPCLINASHI